MKQAQDLMGCLTLEFTIENLCGNICGERSAGETACSTITEKVVGRNAQALLNDRLREKRLKFHAFPGVPKGPQAVENFGEERDLSALSRRSIVGSI